MNEIHLEKIKNYILSMSPNQARELLLELCRMVGEIRLDLVNKTIDDNSELELVWYRSLEKGDPDYSVYESDEYIGEAFTCWVDWSRKYLKTMEKNKKEFGLDDTRGVLDLGCGCGFTTLALTNIFPGAKVIGTNVVDSKQMKIAKKLVDPGQLIGGLDDVNIDIDLVFASEYFEHIYEPINHLLTVLELEPRTVVCANTFITPGIGHFPIYGVNGNEVEGKKASKIFYKTMRDNGYEKMELGLWNNRPQYWRKRND